MKKLLALAAAASLTAFAAPAFAETSASIGWSQFSIADLDLDAITGKYSWRYADSPFGVEVEGAFGLGDDKAGTAPSQTVVAVRSVLGVFATAQVDVGDNITLFGRAGLANVNVTERNNFTSPKTHIDDNAGGSAFGVGGIWRYSDANGVRFEYTRYNVDLGRNIPPFGNPASFSDEDPDSFTISFVHKFGAAPPPPPAP
jgi:hypothetical protein